MFEKNKKKAHTHEENRKLFCLFCIKKKTSIKIIKGALKDHVEKLFNCDLQDERLPTAICSACQIRLYATLKEKESEREKLNSLKLPDYSKYKKIPKATRSQENKLCDCYLCNLARKPGHVNFGRDESDERQKNVINDCVKCGIQLENGKCDCSRQYNNLKERVSDLSTKEKEHLVSSLLKDISVTKNLNENRSATSISLSQERGKPLNVTLIPNRSNLKRKRIDADDILKVATNFDLSTNKVHGIASALRTATNDRLLLQPNLKQNLFDLNHSLDHFFEVKKWEVTKVCNKKTEVTTKTLVFCNNVKNLIEHIKKQRKITNKVHIKIGIDGGGGFLKICASILSEKSEPDTINVQKSCRSKYTEGVAAKKFKESGVKKLLILALVDNTQENYDNVLKVWSLLNLNDLDESVTIATDLKLANILVGIMSHASLFPCTWCFAPKAELIECGEYRTLGECISNSSAFEENGSKKKKANNYKNSIHPPIFTGDDNDLVLDVIPPPQLHLLLGVVNTMCKHMSSECEADILRWTKECNVSREFFNGSPSFAGNSCKKLLNEVDVLRSFCCLKCLKYVQCFKDFRAVVDSCFSQNLEENYEKNIFAFKKSYIALEIPVTPKVHAVFFHVLHFCRRTGKALGFFSEQSIEAVHADFKATWSKYKTANTNSTYSVNLLKAVQEYNSRHV